MFSYVKLNLKVGLFSSIFLFERVFISKITIFCFALEKCIFRSKLVRNIKYPHHYGPNEPTTNFKFLPHLLDPDLGTHFSSPASLYRNIAKEAEWHMSI